MYITMQGWNPGVSWRAMAKQEITWLSTAAAARHLGITPRTLYRLIDEGEIAAYKFGRVIRLQEGDVNAFIERSRIAPGSLEHLYPDPAKPNTD
jgi:excisionase family DNA binding protein